MGWFRREGMLEVGDQAPEFELKSLGGGAASLTSMLERGPVLLAFFKVTCPVCQMTWPYLERLHQAGLQVVGISQDAAAATEAYNREYGATFTTLLDDPKNYAVSNAFRISMVPSLFLVEPDGRISLAQGGFSKAAIEAAGERVGTQPFRAEDRVPEMRPG
ncbi:MAG: peroxiredoxin family protein [bacterium]|jgi:peroxiredoxin